MDTKSSLYGRGRWRRQAARDTRRSAERPSIPGSLVERLEDRRLLSADLAPGFAGSVPAALQPAAKNQVTVRVGNVGDAKATGPVTVRVFASADAALDAADVPLAGVTKSVKLKPGKFKSIKVKFNTPATLATGNYSLLAQVEAAAGANAEPANDVAASPAPVAVPASSVDLTGTVVNPQSRPVALTGDDDDREAHVDVKVVNNGNILADGQLSIGYFLSSDTTLDAADAPIFTKAFGRQKLKPGQGKRLSARFTLPAGTTPGTYELLALVNSAAVNGAGGIAESDTTNNVAVSPEPLEVVNAFPDDDDHHHDDDDHHHHHDGGFFIGTFFGGGVIVASTFVDDGFIPDDEPPPPDWDSPPPADDWPAGMSDFDAGDSTGADFGADFGDFGGGGDSGGSDFGGGDVGGDFSGGGDFSSDFSGDVGGDFW